MFSDNLVSIIIFVAVVLISMSLRIVKEYDRGVIFFLGKVTGVRGPGLIILIAAVAYYKIVDPQKSVVAIEDITSAVNQISQTTVRNVVGQFSLDQLLSQTSAINLQIKNVIDGHTEPWGAEVTAVEIKDITLPENMQRAMAKEAEAERERRAKIVAAEGEFQAAVKLGEAADIIALHPVALQLRTLQTMAEISVERNSTIIFPAQFMTTVQEAISAIKQDTSNK
jgi:regulator of protease activity HflC (stomatin/prohibitin superfamily)